jgi:ribosomal protein S4E
MIVVRRNVLVDGKVRTDLNYPAGLMDVVSIPSTNDNFRLMYDVKGRFVLHRIDEKETGYKICRVKKAAVANKATIGRNPYQTGQRAAIPYIVTHDARTIRFADPLIKVNDTVKIDLATGKIVEHLPFKIGNLVMATGGKNVGRIGVLIHVHKHPGSFAVAEIKDKRNHKFATRLDNVFAIGEENNSWVSLPRGGGVKRTPLEKQQAAIAAAQRKAAAAQNDL